MIISECHNCGKYTYLPVKRTCRRCLCSVNIFKVVGNGSYHSEEIDLDMLEEEMQVKCSTNKDSSCLMLDLKRRDELKCTLDEEGNYTLRAETEKSLLDKKSRLKYELSETSLNPNMRDFSINSFKGKIELGDINIDLGETGKKLVENNFIGIKSNQNVSVFEDDETGASVHINSSGSLVFSGKSTERIDSLSVRVFDCIQTK